MPIYDFKCQECGKVSEFLVHGFDTGNPACPGCGSYDMDRLLSVPSVLKGNSNRSGTTCCGRTERCETPPCSSGEGCHRH